MFSATHGDQVLGRIRRDFPQDLNRMRTVISVIDLQSDLERERARCARNGDPDKAGLLGIVWRRVHSTADAGCARVS